MGLISPANGQNETAAEIETIAEGFADILNRKCNGENLLVNDFTDVSGNPTELGAYLADELTTSLINYSVNFNLKDRAVLKAAKKKGGAGQILDGVLRTANDVGNQMLNNNTDLEKVAKSTLRHSPVFFKPGTRDKRLKDVQIIVNGKVTAMGDVYRLNITASKMKGNVLVATRKGDLSNTMALSNMEGALIAAQAPEATAPVREPFGANDNSQVVFDSKEGGSTPSDGDVFKKNSLTFESLGCRMDGKYLECNVRLSTSIKDNKVVIYRNEHTKIIKQADGKEFFPNEIVFGDIGSGSASKVEKGLVSNIPVIVLFRFEPGESISVVGRLNINYYDYVIREYQVATLDNIFVQ